MSQHALDRIIEYEAGHLDITGTSQKFKFKLEEIPSLKITAEAFIKANLYGDLARLLFGSEVYGYLTAPQTDNKGYLPLDGIVADAYLSHGQVVSPGACDVDQEGISITTDAIKQEGSRIMGWWHSHKGLAWKTHSGKDDRNFRALRYAGFMNNGVGFEVLMKQVGNGNFRILLKDKTRFLSFFFDEINPDNEYEFKPSDNFRKSLVNVANDWFKGSLIVPSAYSLIVMENGVKPYVEIAFQNPFSSAGNKITFKHMPLIYFDSTHFLSKIDGNLSQLIREYERQVRERVAGLHTIKASPKDKDFENYRAYLSAPLVFQSTKGEFYPTFESFQNLKIKPDNNPKENPLHKKAVMDFYKKLEEKSKLDAILESKKLADEFESYKKVHTYTNEQYEALQRRVSELEQNVAKLTASQQPQLQQKDAELAVAKRESAEYKAKLDKMISDFEERQKQEKADYRKETGQKIKKILDNYKAEHAARLQEKEKQYKLRIETLEERARTAERDQQQALESALQAKKAADNYLSELRQKEEILQRTKASYEGELRKKEEEIERLKSEKPKEKPLFVKIKNAAKTVLTYSPVIGAVMKNDKVVDAVTKMLEGKIQNNRIDGKELHEVMYKSGVNNASTEKAIKKRLEEKGIAIEGKIESKYNVESRIADFINNIGFGKYKIGSIGDGLQIYKGKNGSKWDAFKRNTKIGGEVSALIQAAALTTFGYSLYQGASTAAQALEDKIEGTKYSGAAKYPLALASGILAASAAVNSGSLTAIARSTNSIYSQASSTISKGIGKLAGYLKKDENSKTTSRIANYLERISKHNDKLAYLSQLAGQGFMLGAMADITYSQYRNELPVKESVVKHEKHEPSPAAHEEAGTPEYIKPLVPEEAKPTPQHIQPEGKIVTPYTPTHDFTPSQVEELSKAGWKDVGNGKFEYIISNEDQKLGRGISQILTHSDSIIGNDKIISKSESGRLAHIVATTPLSEVLNIGDGTFKDLRNSHRYVVHQGDRLYAAADVVKGFFK